MRKRSLILILLLFMFVSSVSASELNITDQDISSISDDSEISQIPYDETNLAYSDESNNDLKNDTNILSINSNDNQQLSSSQESLINNSDFEDSDDSVVGWVSSGTVIETDESHGNYVTLSGSAKSPAIITQSIDWTNIDKLVFSYKNSNTKNGRYYVQIGDEYVYGSLSSMITVAKDTDWTEIDPIDVSNITGSKNLTITVSSNSVSFDSFTYTTLSNNDDEIYDTFNGYVNSWIKFNYTTTENITQWLWDFGNGTHSTNPTPVYYYSDPGEYRVNLNITNNESESKIIYFSVEIIEEPVANFTFDFTADIKRIIVTDSSSGSIVNRTVDFGDNNILPTPTVQRDNLIMFYHTYESYGAFNVTLTVTDKVGGKSYIKKEIIFDSTSAREIARETNGYYGNSPANVITSTTVESFEGNSTDGWTLLDEAKINYGSFIGKRDGKGYGKIVQVPDGDYYVTGPIEKVINFDNLDKITLIGGGSDDLQHTIYFYIDDELNYTYTFHAQATHTTATITFDTSNIFGNHTLKIMYADIRTGYEYPDIIDKITYYYSKYVVVAADYSIGSYTVDGDNINLAFTDNSYGSISESVWTFDDGTNDTGRSITHAFTKGYHWAQLSIYHDDLLLDTCKYYFTLNLPSINGKGYSSIQDAINNASAGDVIEVNPIMLGDAFSENIIINKTLTLNFNGVILNAEDTALPLINVTNGATVTITNIGLDKDSTIVTGSGSKLIIRDSDIGVDLALAEGNIDLIADNFFNSCLTLVADTTISNSTIANGGVIVNSGKSKIFNTTLTGCDVAVTQNSGELELISNIITGNGVGVNVTSGKTNMEYNVIYSNSLFGLVYSNDDITMDNNWWGVKDLSTSVWNNETLSDDYYAIFRLSNDKTVDIPSFLVLNVTPETQVMGANKEYVISLDIKTNDNGEEVSGYIPTFTLTFVSDGGDVAGETIMENGIGQVTLLTTDKELSNVNITALDDTYTTDSDIVINTEITITTEGELTPGESAVVKVEIPYATGNVTIIVNGIKNKTELVNNVATYIIDELAEGTYNIIVFYDGDDIFGSLYDTKSFDVVKSTDNIINDLNSTVNTQKDQITNLNNTVNTQNETIESQKEEISNLNGTVNTQKEEINNLNNTVNSQNNTINSQNEQITSLNNTVSAQNETINSQKEQINSLNDTVNTQKEQISNLTDTVAEKDNVIASKDAEIKNISVNKTATSLVSSNYAQNAVDYTASERGGYFKARLVDSSNNALANKTVEIGFNGKIYTVNTDKDGYAKLQINLQAANTYTFAVSFAGDSNYNSSFVVKKITIAKKKTTISASAKTFKAKAKTKTISVKLKTVKNAFNGKTYLKSGKILKLTINGKTYKAKINSKGVAKFKIKLTKKGKYTAKIKFAGDKTYKAASKSIKIKIK